VESSHCILVPSMRSFSYGIRRSKRILSCPSESEELSKAIGSIRLEVGGTLMRLAYWLPQLISSSSLVVFN
jgi:hypothetical protein